VPLPFAPANGWKRTHVVLEVVRGKDISHADEPVRIGPLHGAVEEDGRAQLVVVWRSRQIGDGAQALAPAVMCWCRRHGLRWHVEIVELCVLALALALAVLLVVVVLLLVIVLLVWMLRVLKLEGRA